MTTVADLDTPALLVDLDVMERNLARVAGYAQSHNLRLRPHTKTHKIPELGRRQLNGGAAGLTVAKGSEAEVMVKSGVRDLLVAYPVIGRQKAERLLRVANEADITISIDGECSAKQLSEVFGGSGREAGILIELDAGLRRVGVAPGPALLSLTRMVKDLPGLRFRGIAFYPGHIKRLDEEGSNALSAVDRLITEAVEMLKGDGHEVEIVSGGSTPTLFHSHRVRQMNEIRPGTYIFNDRNTWATGACDLEECAVTILTTVVSTAVRDQIIIDGGSKTFSSDQCADPGSKGFGYFPEAPGATLERMNEEHGFVNTTGIKNTWRVGDRIRVLPNHVCVAVNLQERLYGIRGEAVEEVWQVEARGKLQ